jgi:FdhD protein
MVPHRNTARVPVEKVEGGAAQTRQDVVAVEEPLEIRLSFPSGEKRADLSLSVTMRTPGDDFELAAGFLFGEGILRDRSDIQQVSYCVGSRKEEQQYNVLNVQLSPGCRLEPTRLARHFYTTSSCGVCGKASIEAIRVQGVTPLSTEGTAISSSTICSLAGKLRQQQQVFEKTGGLHAAGLFDNTGNLISLREDVGRHNAVDKLIGEQLLAGKTPLSDRILMLSGRASFELVQKALVAGIPVMAAVGAPSSLAVELAKEFSMTLLGFLRDDRFNIYSGSERIEGSKRPT